MQGDPTTWKRDDTPKSFFNPLNEDLVIPYRHENNTVEMYTIPFLQISTYPTYMADHFIKHIVDALVNENHKGFVTPEKRAELTQEVEK